MSTKELLVDIKNRIEVVDTNVKIVLFGSFARHENHKESDIDLLILTDKQPLSFEDETRLKNPLYDLEFETGQIISPIIFSKKVWESTHSKTPFYENILKEGITL